MTPDLIDRKCFICCQRTTNFLTISDSENDSKCNTGLIIRQHFWFQESDLQDGIICESCWEKVNQFHRFYQEVQELHAQLVKSETLVVFIKQDEDLIEEDQLRNNCVELTAVDEELEVQCKSELAGESDIHPTESELPDKPRKKRKYTRRAPEERIAKPKKPRPHKLLTADERQAEDDYIKQHTRYTCLDCDLVFDDFRGTKRHRLKVHQQAYVVCCDQQFRTRSLLYQHVQSRLNPESFKCEICGRVFELRRNYLRHQREIHAAEQELIHKCHRCPKGFVKEGALKRHLAEHETLDNELAKCDTCGYKFGTKEALKKHIKAVHEEASDYICEICSKGFYRKSFFLEHRKTHDMTAEQLKKQCPVCNKWLKSHAYWVKHVRRHRNEGDHKCQECGHVSINLMALKAHMTRRHGPSSHRRHVCELCGKEYSHGTTLKEHVANAHTGAPLYQCCYCSKSFFSNATMYGHRKKDHPQEWLKDHMAKYGVGVEKQP
ncbi:transcription factor grauzone-like [Aedes albopictus]|uniref:C2H2-type domain-containing protein n=1 Tax=Aedes albopictus TaxID=7160 RepID=A0ABM1ZYL3_AEDAL|nr:transcription factor grauzone-like [Aedes albopictus]